MTQGTCVMPDMLRHLEAGGNILVVRGRQGQAWWGLQQGRPVLVLQAQNRRQSPAAGQVHGRGGDVQEGSVRFQHK